MTKSDTRRRRQSDGSDLAPDSGVTTPPGSWARPERSARAGGPSRDKGTATRGAPARAERRDPVPRAAKAPTEHRAIPSDQAPVEGAPARNGAGTAALLCGLLALVFMALFPPIGLLLAIVAIVCGLTGRARGRRGVASNRGQVLAGLLCGTVGLAVSGAFVITEAVYVASHPALIHGLSSCAAKAATSKESANCVQRVTKAIQGAR